ncbi:type II secretion system F family protein [Spirillospora sp. NPDC047279]|uniref:type II secretion system F family protein n=1 Tax=Spirillospora sp. NPDC047279 TaxID=3155478 RepID=UPI0034096480
MNADIGLAAVLGAVAGLGLVLCWTGLRARSQGSTGHGWSWRRWRHSPARVAAAVGCAVVVGGWTRWPVGAVLAAVAFWWLPDLLGPDRQRARLVARIEAVASWTESLRDTLAGAAGLEQTILATAAVAPPPIAEEVAELAARLEAGDRLGDALHAFADRLADPTADLVAVSLILAAETEASDLGRLLGRLAAAAREQAGMRMRVAAGRARVRSSVRIIVAATLTLAGGLLLWSREYLAPYDSAVGQSVLIVIGVSFAGAFGWLRRISRIEEPRRVLGAWPTASLSSARGL